MTHILLHGNKHMDRVEQQISNSPSDIKKSYAHLKNEWADRVLFDKYINKIRNKHMAHYDFENIELSIKRLAKKEKLAKLTVADQVEFWNFEISDKIQEDIINNILGNIKDGSKYSEGAEYIWKIQNCIMDVAGHLIQMYFRK